METGDPGVWKYVPQTLLLSSMISVSNTGNKSQDTWGNIKIPFYESLDASVKDEQGFVSVPTEGVQYTSLIGIPVSLPEGDYNSTFTIQSWYWTFQNSNLSSPLPDLEPSDQANVQLTNLTGNLEWSSVRGQTFQLAVPTSSSKSLTLPIPLWFQASNPEASPLRDGITNLSTAVTQTFVESRVSCSLTTCAVTAMREAAQPQDNMSKNVLSFTEFMVGGFVNAVNFVVGSNSQQGALEPFLVSQSNSNPFSGDYFARNNFTLYTVGTDQLSQRLNVLINTYWAGYITLSAAAGSFNTSYEYLASLSLNSNLMNTTTTTVYINSFQCDRAWLSVLIFATLAMVISSLMSIGVNLMRVGTSDFTDFVWAVTHSNFKPPALPSYLDTHGVLKSLPRTRVQVRDACPSQEFGKVVIGEQNEAFGKALRGRTFE
jgi:hypothetical protein